MRSMFEVPNQTLLVHSNALECPMVQPGAANHGLNLVELLDVRRLISTSVFPSKTDRTSCVVKARAMRTYWTVRVTDPELVAWCVCGGGVEPPPPPLPPPPPPQPILKASAATRTIPRQAVTQKPRAASFLLKNRSGSRRIGSRMNPVAAPDSVSVNTIVI